MLNRKFNSLISRNVFKINNKYTKAPKKVFYYSFWCFVILLLVFGFYFLDAKWMTFFKSMKDFGDRIKEMVSWDFKDFNNTDSFGNSFMKNVVKSVWTTISMAFAGSILGVIISIPISIMAASNMVANKFLNNFAKFIIAIFRTIPSFTYALILVGYFGQTTLTITIAITIFSFSITSKFLFERIEHINTKIFISMQATGAGKIKSFRAAVLPQISSHIISAAFYALETNIRYISVIAGVTGIGIGQLIDNSVNYGKYGRVGFLLFILICIIIMLEILIYVVKTYIVFDKDYLLDQKEQKKIRNKIKKIKEENNLVFYIKNVLLKDWYVKYNQLKKDKVNNAEEIHTLLKEKKSLVKNFKVEHKEKIKADKASFQKYKLENVNSKSWFIFDEKISCDIRLDKIYITEFTFNVLNLKSQMQADLKDQADNSHKKFNESLTVEKVLKANPLGFIKRVVMYLIILVLFCYSLSLIEFKLENEATITQTNKHLIEMFKINWASLFSKAGSAPYSVIYLLFEGIAISVVGTTLGAIIAYILGIVSSQNITNFFVAKFFVGITSALRAIPSYIYAIIFISLVGMGPFTGALALMMGTVGMLSKYNREVFDEVNMKLVAQLQATGLNSWQRIRYGILPQTSSSVVSYIIYRFDINFKEVSVLGAVGASNMGYLLNSYFQQQYFPEFGALLLGIICVTLLVETISTILRNKINYGINPKWVDYLIIQIKQYWFAIYKANEKLVNKKDSLEFNESYAFYGYTNKFIDKKAKEIKNEQKISYILAWYKAYCQYFELKVSDENNVSYKETYKKHNKLFKETIYEFKLKRKELVKSIKTKQLLHRDELLNNFGSELSQIQDIEQKKAFKKDFRNSLKYIKKNTRIQINNLDY
ncbi:phosphonate ABC transporter permease [Spiroplasma helicoides]|uniref:Phosphonate ABC transporter permease n=1 Tax=Spiroplasma helicoides TaxID=216938 RepID=A0A1B3SL28_9MOLU|nr:ABC transporter permease subunit [Spiroplasma helicoides]AOG60641.1 phosphonate ABC transporter permease [Spiroplasma helicoides]